MLFCIGNHIHLFHKFFIEVLIHIQKDGQFKVCIPIVNINIKDQSERQ